MKDLNVLAHLFWFVCFIFVGLNHKTQQHELMNIRDSINTIEVKDSVNIEKQAYFNTTVTMVLSSDKYPIKKKERLRKLHSMSWGDSWGE